MALTDGLMFRAGTEQDRAYIADSIRRTLRGQPYSEGMSNEALSILIDPILATYRSLVLCPVADPASILAFLVYGTGNCVAWIQVRQEFRHKGYARGLLGVAGIRRGQVRCSLLVHSWAGNGNFPKWAESKGYKLRFRPWDVLEIMAATETKGSQ